MRNIAASLRQRLLNLSREQGRPTMDVDMLGRTNNEADALVAQLRDIVSIDLTAEDGLIIDGDSLQAETITEDADYEGVRIL